MLWLYDADRVVTHALPEHASLIETRRFHDHSDWTGRFPLDTLTALRAAAYATIEDGDECYLVENVREVTNGLDAYVEAGGRSATALLHDRTLWTKWVWTAKPGAIVKALVESLTGDRVLAGLAFGTGHTLGSDVTMQRSWGDMGDVCREVLSASDLSMRARLSGASIILDVYGATTVAAAIGEAYGSAAGSAFQRSIDAWKNYAVVLGEGEDPDRVRRDVDESGSDPIREMYVDARDLQITVGAVTYTAEQYNSMLDARGAEKLAEQRVVEFAEATLTTKRAPGDVVFYDSGRWTINVMVTEAMTVYEGGTTTYSATIGEPPLSLRRSVKRIT